MVRSALISPSHFLLSATLLAYQTNFFGPELPGSRGRSQPVNISQPLPDLENRRAQHLDLDKRCEFAGIFVAATLGFVLRMIPLRSAITDGGVLFYGSDSFYHMRRVFYTIDHFPHTLWFDSYLNYPHGMNLTWPPLFDQFIAGISLILGANTPKSTELIGAIVPPILGVVTIVALYLLAKELFGRDAGLLSAFLLAISPQHASVSAFGRPDHHVLETLLMVSIILFLVIAFKRRDNRTAVISGVLIATLAYTWIGTPIYLGILLTSAMSLMTLDLIRWDSSKHTWQIFAISFGTAFAFLLPYWNEPWLRPSFFAVLGGVVFVLVLGLLSGQLMKKGVAWPFFPLAVLILVYCFFIFANASDPVTGIYTLFRAGLDYLFGGELSYKVSEATPLYAVMNPISMLGLNLMLAIMGLAYIWRSNITRSELLFLIWTLLALGLAVAQNRFLYLFSANMSILIALFFLRATEIAKKSSWSKKNSETSKFLVLALLIFIFLPSSISVMSAFGASPRIVQDGWLEPLMWLQENTPETSGFGDPKTAAEYGVLSWWDCGNWILYEAQRPVVANNFQAGAKDAAKFFLAKDEALAEEVLSTRHVRYVITDSEMLYAGLPGIVLWTDQDISNLFLIQDGPNPEHTSKFMRTTLARCHIFDCDGMEHLRLIYESRKESPQSNQVKIFERVRGARITGTAKSPLTATLNVTTNQGRHFEYTCHKSPHSGRYEIVVPYSTDERYGTCAIELYKIVSGNSSKNIMVGEDDVILGRTIELNF